jgi:hypothetical protein
VRAIYLEEEEALARLTTAQAPYSYSNNVRFARAPVPPAASGTPSKPAPKGGAFALFKKGLQGPPGLPRSYDDPDDDIKFLNEWDEDGDVKMIDSSRVPFASLQSVDASLSFLDAY